MTARGVVVEVSRYLVAVQSAEHGLLWFDPSSVATVLRGKLHIGDEVNISYEARGTSACLWLILSWTHAPCDVCEQRPGERTIMSSSAGETFVCRECGATTTDSDESTREAQK